MSLENPLPEEKIFYVGLCMAGAVSAGAYTAGVMDYLLKALEEWQKRKDAQTPGTPSHNVIIPVIGGASAGGMTGIISAAALHNEIRPVDLESLGDDILKEQPQNKFYHSWVDLIATDMFPLLLNTKDIEKSHSITSLLNSGFIDDIAAKVVGIGSDNQKELPPYISKQLKIFTTLTNLEGFGYDISFRSNIQSNKYYMGIHNDYACFELNTPGIPSSGWMPLDFKTGKNVDVAKDSAMATGAFPLGLASRTVTRESEYVNHIPWLTHITNGNPVKGPKYTTQNIDGGTINNEPFEKVQLVLSEITGQKKKEDFEHYRSFESTVLMIDPFPSEKAEDFKIDTKLFATLGKAFGAVIGQMRAKPETLIDAMDSDNAGQYLVAPSRIRPTLEGREEDKQGEKAIACGAMGGFSGFINKEFRIHDYFLGRFNCEIFLRRYFTIPAADVEQNQIFKNGYSNIDASPFIYTDQKGQKSYQIIPIFTEEDHVFKIPVFSSGSNWPVLEDEDVERFRDLMKKRAQAILLNIAKLNWFSRILLWIGAKAVMNKLLAKAAMNAVKKALKEHELLRGAVIDSEE